MADYAYHMKRTVDATVEPITVAECKDYVRQDDATDDTLIGACIKSARQWCEEFTGRAFITQTWTQKIDWLFPQIIYLPHPPVISVSSIAYTDTAGSAQTLASSVYTVDVQREPGRVFEAWSQSWPSVRPVRQAITVTYTAGYGTGSSTVPEPIRMAVRQLALHSYDSREPVITGMTSKELEMALKSLLWPFRVKAF